MKLVESKRALDACNFINIYTNIETAKIFLPSHHACKRTPPTSKLVPSHRASHGGRGDNLIESFGELTGLFKSVQTF